MVDFYMLYSEYTLLLLIFFMSCYIKTPITKREKSSGSIHFQLNRISSFLKEYGGNHVSHLIFLQDKEVYWASQERVLIAYKRIGNKLVVLGDPIGEDSFIQDAIKEFCEDSERKGLTPIFYQISPHIMHYYHDSGFRFLKLGEEGKVSLKDFSLEGKQGAKLRTRVNKFARNSFTFQVVEPPYSAELYSEIKGISDSWLGSQKEKGFSVVSFSEEYISRFPIALLKDADDKIIAFSTLATDYQQNLSIDLMRKLSDSPHGTMDVLFIHIFKWAKEKGYQSCSLGMAPLSNVGNGKCAFTSEKLLRLAYLYGNSYYNFKGLKEFKGKFASSWEPKYLACKRTFLPILLLQLLVLINRLPNPTVTVSKKIKYLFKRAG